MSRKKRKRNNTNNNIIPLEIDYNKLADAIVVAQKRISEKEIPKRMEPSNIGIKEMIVIIWRIWTGKKDTKGQLTTGLFIMLGCTIFRCISLVLLCLCLGIIGGIVKTAFKINMLQGVLINISLAFQIAVHSVILIAMIVLATFVWGASIELENEPDKNYIISIFSVLIALLAIIVSLSVS